MNTPRKPLVGILSNAIVSNDDIFDRFDSVTEADDLALLPRGSYVCLATKGERTTARTGTPGYSIEFEVIEGEYLGRRLWRTWFFTDAALTYTKRDLQKFGIGSKEKLEAPFPANRMVFRLTVVLRKDDDSIERNEVKSLELLRVVEPVADPFAPEAEGGEQ